MKRRGRISAFLKVQGHASKRDNPLLERVGGPGPEAALSPASKRFYRKMEPAIAPNFRCRIRATDEGLDVLNLLSIMGIETHQMEVVEL